MKDKMEWEYKITKSDLGYNIYRIKEENWIINMEWLQRDTYTLNRDYARTFYTITDAMSNLVIARSKWKRETPTTSIKKSESEDIREKRSWSEL